MLLLEKKIFKVGPEETRNTIANKIRSQWMFYQNEEVKEEWYVNNTVEDAAKRRNQAS